MRFEIADRFDVVKTWHGSSGLYSV
jgi:hypothetical protein